MSYVEFERFESKILKDKFISQLDARLRSILKRYSKNIHLSFHRAVTHTVKDVYLVMVTCSNDWILIELGNKYGFPRGFPILWIPDVLVQCFGFYPKFDNDDRQIPDAPSEFDGAVNITFFKKWSGFLGQFLPFKISDNIYWTVTSKNSADKESPFVKDARRLFEPYITPKFLEAMIHENCHLCAECMSQNDQTHGARVLKETPIITSIGKGYKYNPSNKIPTMDSTPFVVFHDCQSVVRFCRQFDLPCDSAVSVSHVGVATFLGDLSKQRDIMTDNKLQQLLDSNSGCVISRGTVQHREILCDFLEGLVLMIEFSPLTGHHDRKVLVKKYKFPLYTIRTMLLREVFISFSFNHMLKRKARKFVDRWCVTSEGQDYWYKFALQAFLLKLEFISPDLTIGDHIHIADAVWNQSPNNLDTIEGVFDERLDTITQGTVIICIGPIGCGKSSIAEAISKHTINGKGIRHIDGDDLGLGTEIVMKLGGERSEFTRSKIIQGLMEDVIPVISTGGGVLFSYGKKQVLVLRDLIYQVLRINVRIIVCIGGRFDRIVSLDKSYVPTETYQDLDSVKISIRNRINSGNWTLPSQYVNNRTTRAKSIENFANLIAKKSSENKKFATSLIRDADYVFGFPVINNNNFGLQDKLDYSPIIQRINHKKHIDDGNFGQIRILVQIGLKPDTSRRGPTKFIGDMIRHITWLFDARNNTQYTLKDFQDLRHIYAPDIQPATRIDMTSSCGKSKISFVVPAKSIHQDGSTHITIDLGDHAPKETGTIVRAMNMGESSITLSTKKGQSFRYEFNQATRSPCQIRILDVFGI